MTYRIKPLKWEEHGDGLHIASIPSPRGIGLLRHVALLRYHVLQIGAGKFRWSFRIGADEIISGITRDEASARYAAACHRLEWLLEMLEVAE